jgi:hypothetical protein
MVDPTITAAMVSVGTAAAASAANAIANAVKASGAIIKLEPDEFSKILSKTTDPLIVVSPTGFKKRKTRYLFSWKGFVFFCETKKQVIFPKGTKTILSNKIWVPN